MRERQVALGVHASTASITADMAILDTCFEHMQEKFAKLEDEYPEHRVDNDGEALPPQREAEFHRVESEYREGHRDLFIARENLLAQGNAPAQVVPAGEPLNNPIKKRWDKLVVSMRAQLTQLQEGIEGLPPGNMTRILALEEKHRELVRAWEWSEELTAKLNETGLFNFDDLTAAQVDVDTEFEGPLETARIYIIAKRMECEVLFEETAAFATATAREALTTAAGGVGARRGSNSSGLRIKVAKMDPLRFSGKMKDYPIFREDWLALVTPELEDHEQRIQIRNKDPEQDRHNLGNMSSME